MSTEKARRVLLERLEAGGGTALLALLLDLPTVQSWADGTDADGRTVYLIGRQALGDTEAANQLIDVVCQALRAGQVPERVCAIAFKPKASQAFAEILAGHASEVLLDGPRSSGKTHVAIATLLGLAEQHQREGAPGPLKALWLHASLVDAALKTGGSLEHPHWGGVWRLIDDRRIAVATLGGVELVRAHFVGVNDETSAERLRAECHVVFAEEVVGTFDDAKGVNERSYELALTSMRLPTARRAAVSTTNPGDLDSWPYQRWIEGGGKLGCVRCPIPASDRLSPEEIAALQQTFRESPDLAARLARGEWCAVLQGEQVAAGFRPDLHVAPEPLQVVPNLPLLCGHDAGLTPTTVIGQEVGGELRIFASLVSERAGSRQHFENLVRPWLAMRAPWALRTLGLLISHYDPSMDTPDQGNLDSSPANVLREILGGVTYPGPVSWPGRRDPLLALLARLNPATGRARLQLDADGCRPLIQALSGKWVYPTINGQVSRDLPLKSHPASDLGDSICYLVAGVAPSPVYDATPVQVETRFDLGVSFPVGPRPF
jgi:hypothetical protein